MNSSNAAPAASAGSAAPAAGAAAAATTTKTSWLSRFGHVLGRILGVIAKDAKPIADAATPVAEALLPQFAPEIQAADNLVTNIAKQAVITEGIAAAAGAQTGTGAQKLESVLLNIGPEIDQWVAARFPGAKAVTAASKAGLVSAVVTILNEVDPAAVVPAPPATS